MPEIPGYRVLRLLGRGGMSYVYLGVQESLDRQVAIKVIQPEALRDEVSKLRFEREAQTIAKLQHPCIVGIFEIGRTEHGLLYYVLPYLSRGHLGQRDLSGDQHAIVDVLRALLWALDYAHGRGVVHRDVKAENVLFDNADRPLLTDFGIALSRRDRTRVTGHGLAVGSGAHMAPEQARGESVDGRADLYSLGVLTFEMLTGSLPYRNPDALGLALMHAVDPLPMLPAPLAHWQPLIDGAMAKQPQARFADAQAMMTALDEVEATLHRLPSLDRPARESRRGWLALGGWARAAQRRDPQPAPAVDPAPHRDAARIAPVARPRSAVWAGLRPGQRAGVLATVALLAAALMLALWTLRPQPGLPPARAPEVSAPVPAPASPSPADDRSMSASATPVPDTTAAEPEPEAYDTQTPEDPSEDLPADARLLAMAAAQISQRQLSQPPGNNAYESLLAAEALSADPRQLAELGEAWLATATPYLVTAVSEGRDEAALALLERGRELSARLRLQPGAAVGALRTALAAPLIADLQRLQQAVDLSGLRELKTRIRRLALPIDWFEPHWSRKLVLQKPGDPLPGAADWRLLTLPDAGRPGLAMQAAPVSRAAFAAFAAAGGRVSPSCRVRTAVMTLKKRSWSAPGFDQQGDHPVVCISRADALAYAAWAGRRQGQTFSLPSATDWQRYAAHPGGRCPAAASCSAAGTRSATASAASSLGIHASQGNVREWLADGPAQAGGSWRDLGAARAPRRGGEVDPLRGYDDIGFRLVRQVALAELETAVE